MNFNKMLETLIFQRSYAQYYAQSFQFLAWSSRTRLRTVAIFFPNALPQSRLDLVSDWLNYQFLLQGHVAHPRTQWSWRLMQSSVAATCPMKFNKLNSVRHVVGINFAQIPCCTSEKVSAHTKGCVAATCPWNVSRQLLHKCVHSEIWYLQHVPATHPCNMSPECALNTILSLLHVAATCSCNIPPRVGPPLGCVFLWSTVCARFIYS